MARVIGTIPSDRSENEVLKELKNQCSKDWTIISNICWSVKDKKGYVRDGEADFAVLIPESGLVVIEVKGSRKFKVKENGIWARFERGKWIDINKKSPPEQATKNMHELVGLINEKNNWNTFKGRYSYVVVYPQGEISDYPQMFDKSTVVTKKDMGHLPSALKASLEERDHGNKGKGFSPLVIEAIIDLLKDRKFYVASADTNVEVEDDLSKIEMLTRQQHASLRGLFQLPSVAVLGPAGSGKTLMAMWRMMSLVEHGSEAIYVCYNKNLAHALQLRHPDYSEYIWSVDKLFTSLLKQPVNQYKDAEFYRESLPLFVMDQTDSMEKYDAIIVDEGQDFSENQIIGLLELLAEDNTWAFFADWNQNLYNVSSEAPIGAEVIFHLYHNCRNTVLINDASNKVLNSNVESMPGMPEGVSPEIRYAKIQSKLAWELAKDWKGKGSVAILSPFKLENSSLNEQRRGHGLVLSEDIADLNADKAIYFSTIKSFKGIEASSVIVIDTKIPNEHKAFSQEDLYVACTRATARLALITSEKEVDTYLSQVLKP